VDASLKANADVVAALQKSAPLMNLSKQLGQLQANFAAFDVEVAELKQRPTETSKRLDALDASVQALGARVDEIRRSLETAAAAPVTPSPAAPGPTQTPPRLRPRT
jgi:chaperonin cofactor prefoldin